MDITGDWKNAFLLEMKVANIISLQAKYGTQFDSRSCKWLIHSLTEKIAAVDREMIPLLPKMMNIGSEYKKPFKLNGQFMKHPGLYCESMGLERKDVGGPFTALWYTPFDPSKQARVKQVLLDFGWMPTEWNIKKMPFQLWQYKRKLEGMSYEKFIKDVCDDDDRELFLPLINAFIEKHFRNQSIGYMRAILSGIGFDMEGRKKAPTFSLIKKQLLLSQYWPTSPKITEDSFESMDASSSRVAELLKNRMMMSHRKSLLEGLLAVMRPDGKISGEANPCATPTARMTHKKIVNIPAAGAFLGKECRKLFRGDYNGTSDHLLVRGKDYTIENLEAGLVRRKAGTNILEKLDKGKWVEEGYCWNYVPRGYDLFVGGDGAGLELRMLTHYLIAVSKMLKERAIEAGNKEQEEFYESALQSAYAYRDVLLTGDIHSHNQKLAGLPTRKAAKGFIYAFLYGAGNGKLGSLVGGGVEEGKKLRETFLRECPCIPALIEWVQDFAKANGWVPAIDGRKLMLRRDAITGEVMAHKALNLLLQAAGSIVMKYSMCFLDTWIKTNKVVTHQVIMMHKLHCASKIV